MSRRGRLHHRDWRPSHDVRLHGVVLMPPLEEEEPVAGGRLRTPRWLKVTEAKLEASESDLEERLLRHELHLKRFLDHLWL